MEKTLILLKRNMDKKLTKEGNKLLSKFIKDLETLEKKHGGRVNVVCLIRQDEDESWNSVININTNP